MSLSLKKSTVLLHFLRLLELQMLITYNHCLLLHIKNAKTTELKELLVVIVKKSFKTLLYSIKIIVIVTEKKCA